MIPKKIFQTHEYDYEDLPQNFKQTSLSWKNLNPGWEYIYHNKTQREQYVVDHAPKIHKMYTAVKPVHKADIWRYLIIYNEGGVYADMDSFCSTPMDYILNNISENIEVVVVPEEKNKHINNANFAAVKESKVIKEMNDFLESWYLEMTSKYPIRDVLRMSNGPIHDIFNDTIHSNISKVSQTMVAIHSGQYKRDFAQESIVIDYFGEKIPYGDLKFSNI